MATTADKLVKVSQAQTIAQASKDYTDKLDAAQKTLIDANTTGVTEAKAAAAAADSKAEGAQSTADEAKTAASTADGKAVAAQGTAAEAKAAAEANAADIAEMQETITSIQENAYDDTEIRNNITALGNTHATDKAALEASIGTKANATDVFTKEETNSAIATAVANAGHLKREIVTSLPEVSAADEHTIYMVLENGDDGDNKYIEYMVINDAWEKTGTSDVDLTGYSTTEEMNAAIEAAIVVAEDSEIEEVCTSVFGE